jgi:flavin-dependent dehydrogenase
LIHRHGPRRLKRWGLLDRVVASGCPPVTSMTIDFGDFPLTGKDLVQDGVALGYAPRRWALDKVLIEAAAEAGAEVREEFPVESFISENGRICGIRGRRKTDKTPVHERATVTVGADGRNSRLAKAVNAPAYEEVPPLTCWYFSYWSGVAANGLEIFDRNHRVVFAFPTNGGLFGVFVAWPASKLAAVRRDIEGEFMTALDGVPDLAERVRSGRREERFFGATDLPNFLRRPFGPGWALAGDAGCHKDPLLALGICDAFRDAELLANALDDGLSGRRDLEQALAEYERLRNEATMPEYRENLHMAQFKPLPEEASRLRTALRGNQDATNRFYLAREGMIPPETFFNPGNLQTIMATAGEVG